MSTFLRTLALTAVAIGAIACVPQDGGYYGGNDYGYQNGQRQRYGNDDRGNSCRRAYNNVCDEGRYGGTNKCDDGTDTADCRGYSQRNSRRDDNSCRRANNGVCDEGRYGGTNKCDDHTDTSDCRGGGGYSRRNNNDNNNNGWPFDD